MKCFYRCPDCGLVYCFAGPGPFAGQCCSQTLEDIDVTARAQTYTEAGGTIEGIDVTVTIE